MNDIKKHRQIRSYVCREIQLSSTLEHILQVGWPHYGITLKDNQLIDFKALFHREAPKTIEIGFGDGRSLVEMAKTAPHRDFIGIETYRRGIAQVLKAIQTLSLANIRLIQGDAVEILKKSIPDSSIDTIQIFFSDPWPKTRHHKRRLIQPAFIELLSQKLNQGGILHLATDWEHYSQHMMSVISQSNKFQNLAGEKQFASRPSFRPYTKYEKRAEQAGHTIFDLLFQRTDVPCTLSNGDLVHKHTPLD